MILGKGVKEKRVAKAVGKLGGIELGDVELAVGCMNFRPSFDLVLFTRTRVIAWDSSWAKTSADLLVADLTEYRGVPGRLQGALLLTTVTASIYAKSVENIDVPLVETFMRSVRPDLLDGAPSGATPTHEGTASSQDRQERKRERRESKERAAEVKQQERAAEKEAAEKAQRELAAIAGEEVLSLPFGMKTVTLYRNGYVRVGGAFLTGKAPYERLLSIEAASDVGKKSGLGRGLAGVVTVGASLALSPNKRGDLFLTIVTDKNVYSLHEDPPTKLSMKTMHKLEVTGRALIENATGETPSTSLTPPPGSPAASPAASVPTPSATVAQRLQELGELRDSGTVTDEEYDTMRARILADL